MHDGILTMISDNTEDPYARLLSMRFLKDCVKINDTLFNALVMDPENGTLNVMRQIIYDIRDEEV